MVIEIGAPANWRSGDKRVAGSVKLRKNRRPFFFQVYSFIQPKPDNDYGNAMVHLWPARLLQG